jgi:hypothetical protein
MEKASAFPESMVFRECLLMVRSACPSQGGNDEESHYRSGMNSPVDGPVDTR